MRASCCYRMSLTAPRKHESMCCRMSCIFEFASERGMLRCLAFDLDLETWGRCLQFLDIKSRSLFLPLVSAVSPLVIVLCRWEKCSMISGAQQRLQAGPAELTRFFRTPTVPRGAAVSCLVVPDEIAFRRSLVRGWWSAWCPFTHVVVSETVFHSCLFGFLSGPCQSCQTSAKTASLALPICRESLGQ